MNNSLITTAILPSLDWSLYHKASELGLTAKMYRLLMAVEPDSSKHTKEYYPEFFI